MKLTTLGIKLTLCLMAVFIASSGLAAEAGLKDKGGVWRNSEYWHEHHPEWVYKYHPDWAVEREEWWRADHEHHPEWFETNYWHTYPVWRDGDYDEHHQWRSAGWWHEHKPEWLYSRHPEWAEVHPGWMSADHERHSEWFGTAYWKEHRHDWNHLSEEQHLIAARSVEAEQPHAETLLAHETVPHNQELKRGPSESAGKSNYPPGHPPYQTSLNSHPSGYQAHPTAPPATLRTGNPFVHSAPGNNGNYKSH